MKAQDTSQAAHEAQLRHWRRIGPAGRVALALGMSEDLREVSREGIRGRHPDYTAAMVELALRALVWGPELFRRVYPDVPIPEP